MMESLGPPEPLDLFAGNIPLGRAGPTAVQVLRDDHQGIAVYVAPSKALVNQASPKTFLHSMHRSQQRSMLALAAKSIRLIPSKSCRCLGHSRKLCLCCVAFVECACGLLAWLS